MEYYDLTLQEERVKEEFLWIPEWALAEHLEMISSQAKLWKYPKTRNTACEKRLKGLRLYR